MLAHFNSFSWPNLGRLVAGGLLASALAACGGGGGSPGAVPGAAAPGSSTVAPASVSLLASASTIAASGADGTEVTLTAIVKDASNNALPGATVSFKASSGTISNTVRTTDASGSVIEKLSVKGDPTARDITITASSGSVNSAPQVVTVIAASAVAPKLLLTSNSGTLASSGAPGTQVAIRALVLDSNNVVVPGTTVTFATDSGSLSASQRLTDASGIATVNLDTGTDPTTRIINVTGTVANVPASVVQVNVVGTKIALNAAATVNVGASSDVTAVLTDSGGNPLANRQLTFSSVLNTLATKSGGASPASTDSAGKLVLSYNAAKAGSDTVTVRALGETVSTPIAIVSSNFSVAVMDVNGAVLSSADTDACNIVAISNFVGSAAQGGTVSVSSSRGTVYADANCTTPLGAAIPLVAGVAKVYLKASGPGIATLTASSSVTSSTVQGTVEFVAPLTSTSVVSLQGSPAVVGANAAGSSSQQVVLRAVVTDKPGQGNPVKNAKVAFSIVSDSSGGTLSQPSEVLTGSDGSATISYIAGTTTTAVDGVVIQASVQSPVSAASATATLTVAQRSLFISAGTGNVVGTPTPTTYQVDYSVFVTDAAGNAVPAVSVTASVRPRQYYKGRMILASPTGPWVSAVSVKCDNEDRNGDGVLGPNEDTPILPTPTDGTFTGGNGNGRLDPVIPMNITSTGKTDAKGIATISLTYPRDRAYWLDVDFTIRGVVAGSEASYVGYTVLPGLASDYGSASVAPPGQASPYGVSSSCGDVK
jgi:protocatechuate 3,4-dioxygenase beta subunit